MNKDQSITRPRGTPVRKPAAEPDCEPVISRGFSRSLLDHSADCIKVLDLEGRLLLMNSPGQKLMEIDDFSIMRGRQWIDFWKGEYLDKARQAVAAAQAGGIGRFTGCCLTARGTLRWWDVAISPVFDESGEACYLLSISRDITSDRLTEQRLRESEEKLRVATDAADIGLWQ